VTSAETPQERRNRRERERYARDGRHGGSRATGGKRGRPPNSSYTAEELQQKRDARARKERDAEEARARVARAHRAQQHVQHVQHVQPAPHALTSPPSHWDTVVRASERTDIPHTQRTQHTRAPRVAASATSALRLPPPAMPPTQDRCTSCSATDDLQADMSAPHLRYCGGCWAWWRAQSAPRVQCAGMTRMRSQCRISSWDEHAGARPLWDGGRHCAHHRVPAGTVCAWCGGADDLNLDPSDGAWYCQGCWDQ